MLNSSIGAGQVNQTISNLVFVGLFQLNIFSALPNMDGVRSSQIQGAHGKLDVPSRR